MKKRKRLQIEFRQREVTITAEGSTLHVQEPEPETAYTAEACPICNSPWISITAHSDGCAPAGTDRIHRALQQSGLHLQVSPVGRLRICQKSFEELKEKF